MAGPRKTATTTLDERMSRAVEGEFRAAAAARWGGAREEFLWRCRRCLEAMIYALLLGKGAKVQASAKGPKTLDELLKHEALEELMPREMRDHAESVRKYGNTGTHFQVDGDVSEASANITASAFAEVLHWYFTRDGADFPAELDRARRALTDRQWRIPSPLESSVELERARAESLHRQLEAESARRDAPLEAPRSHLAPLGIGACAAIFAGAIGYALGGSAAPPATTRAPVDAPTAPPTVTTPRPIEPAPVAPPPAPAPPPVEAPAPVAPPTTPADAATAPAPPRAPIPCAETQRRADAGGHTFCIDADYVTMRDYRRCFDRGACTRPTPGVGCNWQNGAAFDGNAVNCVTRSQAIDYCQQRPEGAADLPTRDELRAMRPRAVLVLHDDTGEWTADDAPDGRAWTRGARSATDFTWTRVPPTRGDRSVSFRCVVR